MEEKIQTDERPTLSTINEHEALENPGIAMNLSKQHERSSMLDMQDHDSSDALDGLDIDDLGVDELSQLCKEQQKSIIDLGNVLAEIEIHNEYNKHKEELHAMYETIFTIFKSTMTCFEELSKKEDIILKDSIEIGNIKLNIPHRYIDSILHTLGTSKSSEQKGDMDCIIITRIINGSDFKCSREDSSDEESSCIAESLLLPPSINEKRYTSSTSAKEKPSTHLLKSSINTKKYTSPTPAKEKPSKHIMSTRTYMSTETLKPSKKDPSISHSTHSSSTQKNISASNCMYLLTPTSKNVRFESLQPLNLNVENVLDILTNKLVDFGNELDKKYKQLFNASESDNDVSEEKEGNDRASATLYDFGDDFGDEFATGRADPPYPQSNIKASNTGTGTGAGGAGGAEIFDDEDGYESYGNPNYQDFADMQQRNMAQASMTQFDEKESRESNAFALSLFGSG
jgi:hypothetical protein